jgi:Ca-activated chloride channel family protein
VTALYEVIPVGVDTNTSIRGLDALRYRTDLTDAQRDSPEMLFIKLRYKDPTGSRSRLISHAVRPPSRGPRPADPALFGLHVRRLRGSVRHGAP